MGIATLGNVAETAYVFLNACHCRLKTCQTSDHTCIRYHQGWDLWGENKARIVAAAEFHASLMSDEPAPYKQLAPPWLTCAGVAPADYPPAGGVIASNGSTFVSTCDSFPQI